MLGSKSSNDPTKGLTIQVSDSHREHINALANDDTEVVLLADSGSTITTVRNRHHFRSYRAIKPNTRTASDASGQVHHAIGVGTVALMVPNIHGTPKRIVLYNVLHMPSFQLDVLSIKQLRASGYGCYLPPHRQGWLLSPQNETYQLSSTSNSLEYLKGVLPGPEDRFATPQTFCIKADEKSYKNWLAEASRDHILERLANPLPEDGPRRLQAAQYRLADLGTYAPLPTKVATDPYAILHHKLGHLNSRLTMRIAREILSPEEFKKLGPAVARFCQACALTKSKRTSIPDESATPIKPDRPWQVMSTDVIGKYANTSLTKHYAYASVFLCHYTNETRVYGMTSLADTTNVLKQHLEYIRAPKVPSNGGITIYHERTKDSSIPTESSSVTTMKSDSAAYYKTPQCRSLYAQHGVRHVRSSAYTQSRNGRVERMIQTLKQSAAAMRAARKLGPEFWFLTLRHASHIHNLIPSGSKRSPYEIRTGSKASIKHLHPFGCRAYAHRHIVKEGEQKSQLGMYVGYYAPSKSHIIYVPPTKTSTDPTLKYFQTSVPKGLPSRAKGVYLETIHVSFDDETLPESVIDGTVPLIAKGYIPYDLEDDDDNIIVGNTEVPIPTADRGDVDTIDVDYHMTHCVVTNEPCCCHLACGKDQTSKDRCVILNHPGPLVDALHPDIGLLEKYPRCMALGDIHSTWSKAQQTSHRDLFLAAKEKEIAQMLNPEQPTLEKVSITEKPEDATLFQSHMLFSLKTDGANNITKGKARWVFGGNKQEHSVHYTDASAFCPKWASIRQHLAKAANLSRRVRVGDVSGAYLLAPPQLEELWMAPPFDQREYDEKGNLFVYRVIRNMYGRVEAGHQWGSYFSDFVISIGFVPNPVDPCMFTRTQTVEGQEETVDLCVYVDDVCIYGNTDAATLHIEEELNVKFGDMGFTDPEYFLGCNIKQTDTSIHINHSAMIDRLAEKYFPYIAASSVDLTKVKTPFPTASGVSLADQPDITGGEKPITSPYRELVGSLSYIALTTRPDICFYTSQLAKVQSNPGNKHFQMAKHCLKYLMTTREYGITYHKDGGELIYYVDASWADEPPIYIPDKGGTARTVPGDHGRRSSYGYVATYAGAPVSWAARLHKGRRALSSTESELVAATEAGKDLVHMRQLLKGMGVDISNPTPLHEDNQSTINQVLKAGITQRSKHIEVRWFYVRDLQDEKELSIQKIHTSEQPADLYTKVLDAKTFTYLSRKLISLPPS